MITSTHVIVGASLAGASASAALRKEGFDGRIVLIGEERERPYERPELSKAYLRGEAGKDLHVHPEGFYEEHGVECVRQLRGELAFVLWDARRRLLVAARDRFGIKPLCFAVHRGALWLAVHAAGERTTEAARA